MCAGAAGFAIGAPCQGPASLHILPNPNQTHTTRCTQNNKTGSHGGNHVEVEGSFDNWTTRQPLQHTGKDWTVIKLLPPGVYQFKFIVDGDWRYDPNQPAMYDEMGNVNNVIEVQEYVPENLDNVSGFDPPPSPPASYCSPPPAAEDFAKEPPAMPPHLQLTLLNVPPAAGGAAGGLPRPQHVVLGHAYLQRGQGAVGGALVVGTTHRYRGKYVTSVLYKPRPSSSSSSSARRREEAAAAQAQAAAAAAAAQAQAQAAAAQAAAAAAAQAAAHFPAH